MREREESVRERSRPRPKMRKKNKRNEKFIYVTLSRIEQRVIRDDCDGNDKQMPQQKKTFK